MPCSRLKARCLVRRRSVSSSARRMESVTVSAYRIALPFRLRAARPIVWISERSDRRNPSLSASRIATSETSGRSSPSRSRLIPTSTSKTPGAQVADDLDALDRIDVGVQIAHLDAVLGQELGQILGHALGERRDQHAFVAARVAERDLGQHVVDLRAAPAAPRPPGRSGPVGRTTCSTTCDECSIS